MTNNFLLLNSDKTEILLVGPGLDWDIKSALAFSGPGGPPLIYIYIMIYTTSKKFLNSKIFFFFLQNSLLLTKPAFI